MPTWLSVLLGVISGIGTLGGILGFSAYLSERAKHKAQKRNEEEDKRMEELAELERQKRINAFRLIVQEEMTPIRKDMTSINKRVKKIEDNIKSSLEADVLTLRCQMKNIRDRVKRQGYADIGDKATINELYEQYKSLGGNNFKEYVNQWLEEVNSLPDEKPENSSKTILVEHK